MLSEADLNNIVSNVMNENRYSHCRLCLQYIQRHYVRFEDFVSVDTSKEDFVTLSGVLSSLLGPEVSDVITGIDAVCTECVDEAIQSYKFIKKFQRSNALLHKVFNNITEALSIDIDNINEHQSMYIVVNEEDSKIVLLDKNNDFKNVCEKCNLQFQDFNELQEHNETCHSAVTCEECLQTFESEIELKVHECGTKFKCSKCPELSSTEAKAKEHQDNAHELFVCKECGKTCQGQDKLKAHEQRHMAKRQCPSCGKTYVTKLFFTKHVKLCLEGQIEAHPFRAKIKKNFFCEKCGKAYSTHGGLRVHDRFVHGNAKPHICEYCGKKFTAPSYLKTHMIKHTGEKKFKCNICGNNFVTKEALLYHTRRHTGEKPYSCELCSEKFVNASARADHIKFKHSKPTLECDICLRKFFTTNFLRQHKKRHHDPSSKLYTGRYMIPPNMPGVQNMRYKVESGEWIENE